MRGDCVELRNIVLNTRGCVTSLMLNIAHPNKQSTLRNATWALSNLCRGKPPADLELLKEAIVPLSQLLMLTRKPLPVLQVSRIPLLLRFNSRLLRPPLLQLSQIGPFDHHSLRPRVAPPGNAPTRTRPDPQAILVSHGFIANTVKPALLK